MLVGAFQQKDVNRALAGASSLLAFALATPAAEPNLFNTNRAVAILTLTLPDGQRVVAANVNTEEEVSL